MSEEQKVIKESWIKSKWRPLMAYVYMIVVIFDFILAPVGWSVLQAYTAINVSADGSAIGGLVTQQWVPITLGAGGLFHLAMGAILGVTAWSRGREKMVGVAGDVYMGGPSYTESEMSYEEQHPVDTNGRI